MGQETQGCGQSLKVVRTTVWGPHCHTPSSRQATGWHSPAGPIIISTNPDELRSNNCPDMIEVIWG